MNIELLQNFGLTKNDSAVYSAVLELGPTKTGAIINASGITSSRVYESLRTLIQKGLVSYDVRNNVKWYRAESPLQLADEMQQSVDQLQALAHEIQKQQTSQKPRNVTNTYEGKRGFKQAFTKHVADCRPGDELCIISYSPRLVALKELRHFLKRLDTDVTIEKKLRVRLLLDKRLKGIEQDKTGIENYDIRYMPAGYFNPSAVNISPYEVMLSVWGEQPIAITITNEMVRESFQQNFEYLWERAK